MCETVKIGDTMAIVCGGHARSRRSARPGCKYCPRESTKLCDAPETRNGKRVTCDEPICDDHATSVGADSDLCPFHARQWKGQRGYTRSPGGSRDRKEHDEWRRKRSSGRCS